MDAPLATDSSLPEAEAATPPDDPLWQYRAWATRLFAILAGVVVLGIIIAISTRPDPAVAIVFLVIGIASLGTFGALIRGLGRAEPWAVRAIEPACHLIIGAGILRTIVALGGGTITIPLEVIGALLVLTRPHPGALLPVLTGSDRSAVGLVVGAMVVVQALPYLVDPIRTGGILGVQPSDLAMTVDVECAEPSQPNRSIPVNVAWSWRRGEAFTPAADGILIQWHSAIPGDTDPEASAYMREQPNVSDQRIWTGGEGEAGSLLQPHISEGQSMEFGIDHLDGLMRSGNVTLDLSLADPSARSGEIMVWVWYAHGGRWSERYGSTRCSWSS